VNDNQMDALINALTRIAEVLESIDDNTIGIDGSLRELVCLANDAAEND
jgi:hypothetical protein